VRDTVNALADTPGGWVALADVRRKLQAEHGLDRAQQDIVLRRMITRFDGVNVVPEDNQKTLTDADHAAALDLGAGPQHLIQIEPPRKSVLDAVRESNEQAARASAVIDSVPGLREGVAAQQVSAFPRRPGTAKPKTEHRVTLPDGTTATRSSQHDYTHAVVTTRDNRAYARHLEAEAQRDRDRGFVERAGWREQVAQLDAGPAVTHGAPAFSASLADARTAARKHTTPYQTARVTTVDAPRTGSSADPELVTVRPEGRQDSPGFVLPSTPPGGVNARAKADIATAYADLVGKTGAASDWVGLAAIRERLAHLPRAEQDAALREMNRIPGVHVHPLANFKSLTQADRDAAMDIGDEQVHAIRIDARGREALGITPPAARAEAVAASTPDAPASPLSTKQKALAEQFDRLAGEHGSDPAVAQWRQRAIDLTGEMEQVGSGALARREADSIREQMATVQDEFTHAMTGAMAAAAVRADGGDERAASIARTRATLDSRARKVTKRLEHLERQIRDYTGETRKMLRRQINEVKAERQRYLDRIESAERDHDTRLVYDADGKLIGTSYEPPQ
jgi:hypothetical protein